MAKNERRRWRSDPTGLTRRDRRPCDYDVYMPDKLMDRNFSLDGDVAADVADAERDILLLDQSASALANTEGLARLILRAESVASSRIEGLEVGARRLLRAEAARRLRAEPRDVTAMEILANIDAMAWAANAVERGSRIDLDALLEAHRLLMAGSRFEVEGGRVRTAQNWIGGSSYNPCSASFVPPPPESVRDLLEDLMRFVNDDSLPAVAQAAIAHAQFETIHPFADGNGRAGRALIHMTLRRRGFGTWTLAPISLILATWSQDYVAGLTETRYVGPPDSDEARAGLNRWIAFFAAACSRAAEDAADFEARVRELRASWRRKLGRVRRDSTANLIIDALPAIPVLTIGAASEFVGRSFTAAGAAIERLESAGVLVQVNVGRRNRAYEAPELIDAFTSFERRLASAEGDTRASPPARRVPRRPAR